MPGHHDDSARRGQQLGGGAALNIIGSYGAVSQNASSTLPNGLPSNGVAPISQNGTPVTLAQISRPSDVVVFGDEKLGSEDFPFGCGAGNTGCYFAGHTGRWNLAFADGHVKSLRPDQCGSPNIWGIQDQPTPADANLQAILNAVQQVNQP